MTRQVNLTVDGKPIALDYFVQSFIDHTVGGMLAGLEGTGEIQTVSLSIDEDVVDINLNDGKVPVNPFVTKIIKNTVVGMISSLKGVSEIHQIQINVRR